jgi:predicted NACHT family NTPase
MNSTDSVLVDSFPYQMKTEGIQLDDRRVIEFSGKWVQIEQPNNIDNVDNIINFSLKQEEKAIVSELSNDPLLNLLCLLVEADREIPDDRCQFYREGLEILLSKWDEFYQVPGDRFYKKLPLQQKQDLLGKVALATFKTGESFSKQDIKQSIAEYIFNLPNAPTSPEVLQRTTEALLKSLQYQHQLLIESAPEVYSFSDIKFHEYFIAREIADASNPHKAEQALKDLVAHISETRWHEVFVLVVSMLRNADYFLNLMKQQADAIVGADPELSRFLFWLDRKSQQLNKPKYKPASFRAFYLEFILDLKSDSLEDDSTDRHLHPVEIDASSYELINFPFTAQQKAILKQYYDANQLILDCLRQAQYMTRSLRTEIEETLLVPSHFICPIETAIA